SIRFVCGVVLHLSGLPFRLGSQSRLRSYLACGPISDAVKPTRQSLRIAERGTLAHQHQERRLKRILGVVRVVQNSTTRAEDERTMPLDERGKRRVRFVPEES